MRTQTHYNPNRRRLHVHTDVHEQRANGQEDDVHGEERGVYAGGLEENGDEVIDGIAGVLS